MLHFSERLSHFVVLFPYERILPSSLAFCSTSSIMAVDSSCEGEPRVEEFMNGNGSLPGSCSCLKLIKSSPADANQQIPLEIPSVVVEETSLPTGLYHPLSSSPGQDVYSISVLSKDDDNGHCASPPAFLSTLEVPNQSKRSMCLDTRLNCQNCIDFQMKSEDVYSPCIIDVPSENENSFSPESYEEGIENCKTDNLLAKLLWRQASFKFSGRASATRPSICMPINNRGVKFGIAGVNISDIETKAKG
ncbi:putative plant/T5J17-70 protein [Senna tora]|uniref:Putative plant/T5J17-70 protein n=1 Tax=Senna tora TaxID=362788 RepID=A0A834X860_9FABA|nr:putative plant/T5J17-70 protein [Senna tora]